MHDLEMVHGDLKGVCGDLEVGPSISLMTPFIQANILINQDCRACLADFGLSTVTGVQTLAANGSLVSVLSNDSVMSFTHGGSIRWMSPELIDPEQFGVKGNRPTKTSDCFAFGMVIYEVGATVGDLMLLVLKMRTGIMRPCPILQYGETSNYAGDPEGGPTRETGERDGPGIYRGVMGDCRKVLGGKSECTTGCERYPFMFERDSVGQARSEVDGVREWLHV